MRPQQVLRLVRGLGALAVLIGLLAGAPAALWMLSREFLPRRVPNLDDVTAALLRPDDGSLLVGLLVLTGWAVWAVLTWSTVAEVIDRAHNGGISSRRPGVPLRPSRAVAALLITWIVAAFTTSTTAAAATPTPVGATAVLVPHHPPDPPAPPAPTAPAVSGGRVHVVAARDTLWDIAATELGDPLRWPEILELNRQHRQPDGGRLTDDAVLHAGWTLTLPADDPAPAGDRVRVHRGDTLTALARDHLGDPARYTELYTANTGAPQPDGRTLTDPDLLRPGWLLRLPDTPPHPDADQPRTGNPDPGTDAPGPPHTPAPAPPAPQSATPPTPSPDTTPSPVSVPSATPPPVPATTAPLTTPPLATAPPPAAGPVPASESPLLPDVTALPEPSLGSAPPGPAGVSGPAEITGSVTGVQQPVPVVPALGVGGLLAAGLVTGLLMLRRRQQRWRSPGRRIALPDADLSRIEAGLDRAAQQAGPLFLDLVLRCLTTTGPTHLPTLRGARLTPAGVELLLDEPQPPPPFATTSDHDNAWWVAADATLPLTTAGALGVANPYPALASLGSTDDSADDRATLLLDLEHAGAVHLAGAPARAADLLRHIAVELAASRWADATTVLTVGLQPDLTGLPSHRVQQLPDLPTALARLWAQHTATAEALQQAGGASLLELRTRDQLCESWLVTVLLIGPDAIPADATDDVRVELADLVTLCADLAAGERSGVAVVTAGFPDDLSGTRITVDMHGAATVDAYRVRVEQMPVALARDVLAILDTTTAPDQPVVPATHSEPWATEMNEDGTCHQPSDQGHADNDLADTLDPVVPSSPADIAPPGAQNTVAADATAPPSTTPAVGELSTPVSASAVDPVGPVDPAAQRRLLLVQQQDPHLDDDLALWTTTTRTGATPSRPLIALLGPPDLHAPGTTPDKRRDWYLEVVVYLALHPHGVDRDKLLTDLWPDGTAVTPPTIRRAIAAARAWTGKDTTTDPPTEFIPAISPAGGDRYRITGHLSDWDLFRRLRKRAHARTAAGQHAAAVGDYTAALGLVRGPVLHPLRARGYAWLHNPDQRQPDLIPGFIIDTAHDLVDLILARTSLEPGDLDLARTAATTAQTVDPDRTSDRPFTDLMRIAHAAGDLDEMRTHAELLLAERDFEVGEDLPPESFAVFNELFPHGLCPRAS